MIDTCVIFAGGKGTRLGNVTQSIPKPLVLIGDKPIIWHIMKHYSLYGVSNFIILAGYKHELIKEYFHNYYIKNSNITIDLSNNTTLIHNSNSEKWKISIIDTGYNTMTSARLYKIRNFLHNDFYLTYGDGLSDINISELTDFHYKNKKICTLTAIQPIPRFGILNFSNNIITSFEEKIQTDTNWINGGFFVCSKEIINYLSMDETISFENGPLKTLSSVNQLCGYKHYGKWMCMDTERERDQLIELYNSNKCFWL